MTAIVDLPTPPFLFATARNRAIAPLLPLLAKFAESYVIRCGEAMFGGSVGEAEVLETEGSV